MRTPRIIQNVLKTEPVALKGDGDELYDCPLCRGRKKLEVSRQRKVWYCHKCALGGWIYGRAQRRSLRLSNITPQDQGRSLDEYRKASKDSLVVRYLQESRGIPGKLVDVLEPHEGPYPLVVYFPCFRLGGSRPDYFQGRVLIDGVEPKYINSGAGKSRYLWGVHRFCGDAGNVVLTEGILDAVWIPTGLGLMGKSISTSQIETLCKMCPTSVTIALDGNARTEALTVAERLVRHYPGPISIARLPSGQDPDGLRDIEGVPIERVA